MKGAFTKAIFASRRVRTGLVGTAAIWLEMGIHWIK